MDSTSKRLLRLQSGWFKASLVSSAYCSRSTANQYANDASEFTAMISSCREWLFYRETSDWVTGTGILAPAHFIGQGYSPLIGSPWINECTISNVVNRMSVPSSLSGFTITGARLILESAGETHRYKYDNSSDINISDTFYCPVNACDYGGIKAKMSTSLQPPGYLWQQTPDINIDADVLNDNTYAVVGVESYTPFSTGIAMPRFVSGAWSAYNFSSAQVSWINTNRTFYLHMLWETMYPSFVYPINYSHYIYSRQIRGLRLEVYCTV